MNTRLTILLQEVQRIPIALLAHIPQHLWAEEGKSKSFGDCLAEPKQTPSSILALEEFS